MSPAEAVKLAREMREAGVQRFSLKGDSLTCVLMPPDPKPLDQIKERIGEMNPEQRIKLLDEAKKDLERDLYGASS